MLEQMQKANDDFQKTADEFHKMGKDNYDAMIRSYGEMSKNFQSIATRWTDYSKRAFEDATHAFEELVSAKSLEQAFEIQANYAKTAHENWISEAQTIGEMFAAAARNAYKPLEQALDKRAA